MSVTKYEKSFKEEVVKYARNCEESKSAVARRFGINVNTLYGWLNQFEEHQEEAFVGSGNLRSKDLEIRKLKREIADLKEENLILKKATAIFSKR